MAPHRVDGRTATSTRTVPTLRPIRWRASLILLLALRSDMIAADSRPALATRQARIEEAAVLKLRLAKRAVSDAAGASLHQGEATFICA